MTKKPLLILTGPTAVGKTALSIALAKAVGGEIISADSMQVYRGMDIGSAKITREEMAGVPHYLIDELEPQEEFHVVRFQELAKKYMAQIYEKGKIPILVGGTGFYIQAVLYDIDFTQNDGDSSYRRELEQLAKEKGCTYLHDMLAAVDPKSAQEIHANNVKRVIRALEFYHESGTPISAHNECQRQKESPYNAAYFVLNENRQTLYERIDRRVDEMLKNGLLDEVRHLKAQGCTAGMVSMQGLGYKEILDYLDGNCTLEEAVYRLKRDTRHFAKRQITWFKREREVIWLQKEEFGGSGEILAYMLDIIEHQRGISICHKLQ
ncbi:tRNA dimethylallyltransferase [Marvinbryantia formatexigens DSM 14469]|uniref:tRNA dimethylallyltransferase n=1 Tax=Marvinbryantia formatexigens DSM 14469 TaxID=478749 RepID=C6LCC3_9FIRM|nr:tRNA (adenosine(37)-N6)-dimethylallyltransferase MiaA [Marvinbryantia formatexigens]EET61587.1 tRNA dimethylallyltransferase [Marvinbryantia formatexigens DSM 14469]UWO24582.1 tRNA (adenosine(37)-N6)-dimethylallyltransferase MiaA [Marvinbryantia formatexigens DSM 14469]SDF14308.1 tRNA dimethylallyltransferase [Marvinbryantia formatexigens]